MPRAGWRQPRPARRSAVSPCWCGRALGPAAASHRRRRRPGCRGDARRLHRGRGRGTRAHASRARREPSRSTARSRSRPSCPRRRSSGAGAFSGAEQVRFEARAVVRVESRARGREPRLSRPSAPDARLRRGGGGAAAHRHHRASEGHAAADGCRRGRRVPAVRLRRRSPCSHPPPWYLGWADPLRAGLSTAAVGPAGRRRRPAARPRHRRHQRRHGTSSTPR